VNQDVQSQQQQQPASAPPSTGATIGEQILAKRAALLSAPQQSNPGLPFRPGAGIPH